MRLVYIAGAFRAPTSWQRHQNILRAEEVGYHIMMRGMMPIVPHKNTENYDGELSDDFFLKGCLQLMFRCDAVFMLSNWKDSSGARKERDEALLRKLPVFDDMYHLCLWNEIKEKDNVESIQSRGDDSKCGPEQERSGT